MIQTAVQRGDWVYVYGENGTQLFYQSGQLMGFTGTSVSIKRGDWIYVYDQNGNQTNYYSC